MLDNRSLLSTTNTPTQSSNYKNMLQNISLPLWAEPRSTATPTECNYHLHFCQCLEVREHFSQGKWSEVSKLVGSPAEDHAAAAVNSGSPISVRHVLLPWRQVMVLQIAALHHPHSCLCLTTSEDQLKTTSNFPPIKTLLTYNDHKPCYPVNARTSPVLHLTWGPV